jgi:lipoprotein signal peptidase
MRQIVCSKDFWLLYSISFFQIFYGYYIISMYKTLGQTKISDDQLLTLIGSVSSLGNGISRFIWSTLLDFFSFN